MRILLLNLGANSSAEVSQALVGQGYEIANQSALGVEQIESLAPELLITEATPSDLSCCGIITQIKSRAQTKSIRVLIHRRRRSRVRHASRFDFSVASTH